MFTSPKTPPWFEEGLNHLWLPYAQMKTMTTPSPVVGAEGVRIRLASGQELIDGVSSWWTQVHGAQHPFIRDAIERQLHTLSHMMLGGLVHEQACRLAGRLAALTPGDLNRVFFSESGSVSVEAAMKMALQFWLNQGIKGKTRFISFRGAYHGDTFAAMSVCDPEEGMHTLFSGAMPKQILADIPHTSEEKKVFEACVQQHAHETAALVLEPLIQGAGGMRFHTAETLRFIAETCRRYDVLLILDEIMTGFGRTGTMFACEQAGITPDIMTLSKALTGGFVPLAATLARESVFQTFWDEAEEKAFMHGPTYTGHALGCAAANASLDLFEREDRLEEVRNIEEHLQAALAPVQHLSCVRDVRVKGAVGVVELSRGPGCEILRSRFLEKGVWVRPLGQVIYLMPPFVISEEDLSTLTQAVVDVVREVEGEV